MCLLSFFPLFKTVDVFSDLLWRDANKKLLKDFGLEVLTSNLASLSIIKCWEIFYVAGWQVYNYKS